MAAANFPLVINYDTVEQTRIVNALISKYTTVNPPFVPTQAQAIEAFRQSTMLALKDIVKRYETEAAMTTALAGVVAVGTLT